MSKPRFTQIISEAGEALWAHLREPETYKGVSTGNYTLTVKFPHDVTNKLLAEIEAEYNSLKKTAECFKGAKPAKGSVPSFGTKELADGEIAFKFKTKSVIVSKATKEEFKRTVPVFDAKLKPLMVPIGNGSLVRVKFSIGPKFISGTNYGVTLYLDSVQVLRLVEYGANAGSDAAKGFAVEDGYEAPEEGFDNNEQTEQGDEEGDF